MPQPPQVWVIGSAADCDLVVSRPTVSGHHCRLVKIGDQFFLDDLNSTNGTFVNGMTTRSRTPVKPGDQILLGSNVPMPWPPGYASGPPPLPKTSRLKSPELMPQAAPSPTLPAVAAGFGKTPGIMTIGREEGNDIVLPFPMVSGTHARIVQSNNQYTIEDLGSTNGTFLNSPDNRIKKATLSPGDVVYFGSMRLPASRLIGTSGPAQYTSQGEVSFNGTEMVIGRDPSCDQVLDYPMISGRHARIFRKKGNLLVQDLGSANGTFVNGLKIRGVTAIKPGDTIGLGSYTFQLTEQQTFQKRDYRGNVTIEASHVGIVVPGKKLLEDVSLTIYPTEFVGLMGPSGAGKTTLMNALNGYTKPTSGRILFNGQDLYENYAQFAHHLGYVPQEDIMHRDLTVGQALYYTAKLRLPPDTSNAEIRARIQAVVKQLGLEGTENVLIGSPEKKGISGGQRKRVNLAMELLTDPSVLFLDEPTSGLSSEDALMVMKLLRDLANSGKAILLTIHQPSLEAYRLMDNLVLVGKDKNSPDAGRLVYYGPAYPDAVHFFNPDGVPNLKPGLEPSPDEVLRGFQTRPSAHWVQAYQESKFFKDYVSDRAGKQAQNPNRQIVSEVPRVAGFHQWSTLVSRNLKIKLKDTWNTLILMAQAPIVAFLVVMVFGDKVSQEVTDDTWKDVADRLPITSFLLSLAALWFGCSNSVREIVGEWAIYHRERMVNIKIPSYVFSKLAVLAGLCVIQCGILLGVVTLGCKLDGNPIIAFFLLMLISFVGVTIGLLLSAVSKTSEVAIAMLPIVLLPMVILGGMMQPLHDMNTVMKSVAQLAPSRWGFETMLLNEVANRPLAPDYDIPGMEGDYDPLSGSDSQDEAEPKENPDMAEVYFPDDERWDVPTGAVVLMFMALNLIVGTHMVLRFRDVH